MSVLEQRSIVSEKSTGWEEKYKDSYVKFINMIKDENPDFIIPVARKSCKLFGSLESLLKEVEGRIFYRNYFNFMDVNLRGKKIVVVDDAVRRTSTLKEYRKFFVGEKGVPEKNIMTYAFVGHRQLLDDPSLKCDKDAKIFRFLPPVPYNEYLMLQSDHFILKGVYQDIDHLILEAEITHIDSAYIKELWDFLGRYGYRYQLAPIQGVNRFGIHSPSFFSTDEVIGSLNLTAEHDFVEKIRFTFLEEEKKLLFVPMVFPKLFLSKGKICDFATNSDAPFRLPCHNRGSHELDEFCFRSISLLLSTLLARKFLIVVEKNAPHLARLFKKAKIRKEDLTRYLGKDIGNSLVEGISEFLKAETTPLDSSIKNEKSAENYDSFSSFSFSRENVPLMLQHLRDGYKESVERNNNNPVGVKKYTKPAGFLLGMGSGTHPLIFTEVVDELCDFGVFVPVTEQIEKEGCWRRVYRTGEDPHDECPWGSAQAIVPFAIQVLNPDGVERMHFEKTLANFICDFPRSTEKSMESYPEYHCLVSKPSYWGPQTFIFHPVMYGRTLSLYPPDNIQSKEYEAWRGFAKFFDFDKEKKKFVSKESLKGVIEKFVDKRLLKDYFLFLLKLKDEFGSVDALNALALCRSKKRFYAQLWYNLNRWKFSEKKGGYVAFLEGLRSGQIKKECLNFSARMAKSVHQKLNLPLLLPSVLNKCEEIANTAAYSFNDIWEEIIKKDIAMEEAYSLLNDPDVSRVFKIIGAIRTLDGLTRLKLGIVSPHKKKKTEEKVKKEGPQEFRELGIDIDIKWFLETRHTPQEIHEILLNDAYQKIVQAIENLPKPEEDLVDSWEKIDNERTNEFFRKYDSVDKKVFKKVENQMISACKVAGLVDPKMKEYKKEGEVLIVKYRDSFDEKMVFSISLRPPYEVNKIGKIT